MSIGTALQSPAYTIASVQPQRRVVRRRHTKAELVEPTRSAAITDPVAKALAELDRAMEAQATAELRKSSYHPVRQVSCEICNRVLILRGRVPSYYMKQIAQTVVRHLLDGSLVLDNQLEVDQT